MHASRRRVATALVLLMIIAPFTSAGMASWNTTNTINPNGGSITVTGFRVPGNGTVLDGWVHVANTDIATAVDSTIVFEGPALLAGGFENVAYDVDLESISMMDDGSHSDISDFAAGDIIATLSNQYKSGPGYTMVYSSLAVTNSTGCNSSSGYEVTYGFDNNFNGNLNSNEIINILYYCDIHTTSNGSNVTYEALVSFSTESAGGNCENGGYKIEGGIDYDDDRNLDTSEINSITYICHNVAIWGPAILSTMNGTLQGANRITSYGTIPSTATHGAVVAATMPGGAVPAGTDAWLIAPKLITPSASVMNGYWMSFDHWYHVDSTASGDGDGAWVEYRIKNGTWSNWAWIAPDGGYPSTLSTSGPTVNGAPTTGALPVFASPTESGWVTSSLTLSNIPEINPASEIQFRFRLWTSPNATTERPGWFIDNIEYNNDGIDYGVWHHGCIVTTGTCQYAASAYGALQTSVDMSGTDGDSWIEIDLEWDLQGGIYDNACVELSLTNLTWTDISSNSQSTTTICEDRAGAIPGNGYTAANGVTYYDESAAIRTIDLSIPSTFQNQSNVQMRFIVDTDTVTNYGGFCCGDAQEGLTVSEIRVYIDDDNIAHSDDFYTPTTASNYVANPPTGVSTTNQWGHHIYTTGGQYESLSFEDSGANAPTVSDASGWSRNPSSSGTAIGNKWSLGQLGPNAGPSTQEPSFPYVYGTNLNGNYGNQADAYLISPSYAIPAGSSATLTFNKWVCTENYWDAIGLYIKVNSGAWTYFDPGIANWYDGSVGYSGNSMFGKNAWMSGDCNQLEFENRQAPLSQYAGDTVKFRFRLDTDFSVLYEGGYIDDFGILIPNYSQPGTWTSPPIDLTSIDDFNLGWIDVDATVPTNTTISGTLLDSSTGQVIGGFEEVDFPISLAGIDPDQHPYIKVQVDIDSLDPEVTPRIKKLSIGGKRFLTAESTDANGWDLSTSIEVVDGLLNATSIAGTITSPYLHSSRPIKSITLSGNYSSGVALVAYDVNGAQLGTGGAGGVAFTYPTTGFALSLSLPTNGWIDRMVFTANFALPALNPAVDVLDDGSTDWSFPSGDDYGHYGWQSLISGDDNQVSATLDLDGSSASSVTVRIPTSASIYSGIVSIASDSDGFSSAVTVTVAGASQSGGSGDHIFYNTLDVAQMGAINAQGTSHTDAETGRAWRDIIIELNSNTAQQVSIARFGIGYVMFENISGLGPAVAAYHDTQTTDDPPPNQINIPVAVSADAGLLTIDGNLKFDYIITNRDFSVPNTFYPHGESYTVTTRHHHLHDNSDLSEIVLRGQASDGEVIEFQASNSADGLWGLGNDAVTITQISGDSVVELNTSGSYIVEELHNDGYTDITVNWVFDISWNWDDVDSIRWVAKALDRSGDTVWPAVAHSGQSGRKAVENDLQIDTFEIRDQYDRLLSNQWSTFYPYPIREGSILNITGNVRFQDATDVRPSGEDFQVRLNLSGSLILLNSDDDGFYEGIVNAPSGISEVTTSPNLFRVGPLAGAIGADDVSGVATVVTIRQDSNPPSVGQIEVNTATGLTSANGKVWDPTLPLSLFVTVEEAEARGEILTLRYWRADVDDMDSDGIADEEEYLSQVQPLTSGMTGEQQVNFAGIDVSAQSFNSPVHIYIEGTDWAGLTYQEGGSGGGPGAENAWATVIIATDEPTTIVSAGFSLDHETGYLLAGIPHTFKMQINEPNGLQTLDNVSIMLCGDGTDNVGKFSYNPSNGDIWTADDSLISPLSVQTQQLTSDVIELSMMFEISWEFPWEEGQYGCKPSVSVIDDITEVAYQNNIGELTWVLDNRLIAIPSSMEDLTPPIVTTGDIHLYLRQGDEFQMNGEIYYAGSGVLLSEIPDDLQVEMQIVYGTQEIDSVVGVAEDGTWTASMTLPMRVPLHANMGLTTFVLNVPGVGSSSENADAQVTVDSKSPTVLFDQVNYPDSSLTVLESDLLEEVLVSVTIVDEIGLPNEDLQVAWIYLRNNLPVAGTEDTGGLAMLFDEEGRDIFQGDLDFSPALEGFEIENGDRILFWVTSTDRAGNLIQGLGSEAAPRPVALRIMVFNPSLDSIVINPKDPFIDETVIIETFWSNDGKRDGTIEINLYELKDDNNWRTETATVELELLAETSSVYAVFEWTPGKEGQPVLYVIIDGDLDNPAYPVNGILVKAPEEVGGAPDAGVTYGLMGAVVLMALALVGFFVMRGRGEDDYYYEDEDDSYFEEETWEYGEEAASDEESDEED